MSALTEAVRLTLCTSGLLHKEARLLCAVSGGVDSVTLLHTLCLVRSEVPFTLLAVHVQHGLRGEESLGDERFVRRLCEKLQVELVVEDAGLAGGMTDPGIETLARERRRQIFESLMQKRGMDAVLLAHHRDDQTETVLMHLLRGAGAQGLQGMQTAAAFGPGLMLRPFLGLSRRQLKEAGYEYREDQSNSAAITARNALRLTVLPEMEKWFPGASAHIAAIAEHTRADEEALSLQAQAAYDQSVYRTAPLMMLSLKPLQECPAAVVRRVVRLWWQDALALAGLQPEEKTLGMQDTLRLETLVRYGKGQCNLPLGLMAQVCGKHAYLMRQSGEPLCKAELQETAVEPLRKEYRFDHLTVRSLPARGEAPKGDREVILSPEVLALAPVFRQIQPGDRIHPFGAPGSKPLRRFLTDRKIPPAIRSALVVLASGHEILWIPSICTAERLRVSSIADGSVRLAGAPNYLFHRS